MDSHIEFSGEEKRKFKRAATSFSVTYSIKSPFEVLIRFGLKELETIARDLGAGGIGLLAHDEMPQGTTVELRFTIFNNASTGRENSHCKFNVWGEVRYSSRIENRSYHVGLRFINISPTERSFIEQYIRDQN